MFILADVALQLSTGWILTTRVVPAPTSALSNSVCSTALPQLAHVFLISSGWLWGTLAASIHMSLSSFALERSSSTSLPAFSRCSAFSSLQTVAFIQLEGISYSEHLTSITSIKRVFREGLRSREELSQLHLCSQDRLMLGPTPKHPPFGLHLCRQGEDALQEEI